MVQWLGLQALTVEGPDLIPGRGTKIPQASWFKQEKKKSFFFLLSAGNSPLGK